MPLKSVMAGLGPAIHVFEPAPKQFVDARHKAGHDGSHVVLLCVSPMSVQWPIDPFLDEIAVQNSIQAALQRSRTYAGSTEACRKRFRRALACQLRREAGRYTTPVGDDDHVAAIRHICKNTSGQGLAGGELRFGVAQKAFNLYLKFLWRLGTIKEPPHCPIDRLVLERGGIKDPTGKTPNWTEGDENEYRTWILQLRRKAAPKSLAKWELDIFMELREEAND